MSSRAHLVLARQVAVRLREQHAGTGRIHGHEVRAGARAVVGPESRCVPRSGSRRWARSAPRPRRRSPPPSCGSSTTTSGPEGPEHSGGGGRCVGDVHVVSPSVLRRTAHRVRPPGGQPQLRVRVLQPTGASYHGEFARRSCPWAADGAGLPEQQLDVADCWTAGTCACALDRGRGPRGTTAGPAARCPRLDPCGARPRRRAASVAERTPGRQEVAANMMSKKGPSRTAAALTPRPRRGRGRSCGPSLRRRPPVRCCERGGRPPPGREGERAASYGGEANQKRLQRGKIVDVGALVVLAESGSRPRRRAVGALGGQGRPARSDSLSVPNIRRRSSCGFVDLVTGARELGDGDRPARVHQLHGRLTRRSSGPPAGTN